jgi:integrase
MLYKRGKNWWVRFTIRGREIRVTSGTDRKTLAEEFERRLREQIWRETELGDIQHTWEEATERWLKEKAHKRSLVRDRQAFATVDADLRGKALCEIDRELLSAISSRLAESRKPGTVNRILAAVRGVLRAAVQWGWLGGDAPQVEAQYVEKAPPRWITPEQFETLCKELPPHAAQMARFAVAVGSRAGNLFRLRWAAVDLPRRTMHVDSSEFKGKRSVGFPLSDDAVRVLEGQQGKHLEFVFVDQRGRAPVNSIKTCWHKATQRAGIPGFRFHDLRHTWAAWHKLAGTPTAALKELGGWSDIRMTDRYGHINPTDYVQYVDNQRTKKGTEAS